MQTSSQGTVLGITDFGPVGGTPIIPPSYLTVYFFFFLVFLSVLYLYFYRKKRPVHLRQKIKLLIVIAFVLKVTLVAGGGLVVAYWLVPTPGIRRTIPKRSEASFSTNNKVEIVFDRPVSRGELDRSISPEVPGRWVYENSLYTTHLYRNLVFYPKFSFNPDTTYTIKLSNIRNLIKISSAYDYQFEFTTQTPPKVIGVVPVSGQTDVDVKSEIKITLDNPNNNVSEFNFEFTPEVEFSQSLDASGLTYTLKPKTPLKQGVEYRLKVQKSDVILDLENANVIERSQTIEEYNGTFTTKQPPGILTFLPSVKNAPTKSEIIIVFSHNMNKKSVTDNFSIDPETPGKFTWPNDYTLTFEPDSLSTETEYKITVGKGSVSNEGGFLEEDLIKTFETIGPVKVSTFSPQNGTTAVDTHSRIKIAFDQEVDMLSAQQKFSVSPEVDGIFSWEGNTLVYTPKTELVFTTTYTVTIASGIKANGGINSRDEFKSEFSTQHSTTKLTVPAYLQKYTLSCEIAALRMALNYRGANVTEDDLIPKVGTDSTPHSGNIWGNPYNAFVGNIKGTQMKDGYGVYWGPIAKAARSYRDAQDFQGWNIEQLTGAISQGNPVVIWVYSHFGTPTSWNTPEGIHIYAVRDEHAVVVVGFVGPADAPTQLVINDPLSGQVYWTRANFDNKWNIFGRSGVVVY